MGVVLSAQRTRSATSRAVDDSHGNPRRPGLHPSWAPRYSSLSESDVDLEFRLPSHPRHELQNVVSKTKDSHVGRLRTSLARRVKFA